MTRFAPLAPLAPLLALLLLAPPGCDPRADDDGQAFNSLPRVDAELNDADPLYQGANVRITLVDADGEQCELAIDVSFDQGQTYAPATVESSEWADLADISCTASGQRFSLVWESETDLVGAASTTALLRFTPFDAHEQGPPHHLRIDLQSGQHTIHGTYVERQGATGAQYLYQRLGLAHLSFYGHSVEPTGEMLTGGDDSELVEDAVVWTYAVPDPPPEHHFHALDIGPDRPGSGAFYLPFVWKDDEETPVDEPTFDPGEEPVGVGGGMVAAYLRPDDGWTIEGWHVIAVDPFAAPDEQLELLGADVDLPVYLKGYTVNGTTAEFDMDVPVDDPGDAAMPDHRCGLMPWIDGDLVPPGHQELTSLHFGPTSTVLPFAVDDDWLQAGHWLGTAWGFFADDLAVERFFLYVDDTPADLLASPGERVTHIGLLSGTDAELSLGYLRGTMTWETMWSWALDDCWTGFNLIVTLDDTPAGIPGWTCHPIDDPPLLAFAAHGAAH